MIGKFISSTEVKREELEWGSLAWFSSPAASNAKDLVVLEVTLSPAGGHNFHKHPNQEELIYVIEGEIEQWVDREKRMLRVGDSAFIGADVVHASFNVSDRKAKRSGLRVSRTEHSFARCQCPHSRFRRAGRSAFHSRCD